MRADLVIHSISQLVTPGPDPQRGAQLGTLNILEDAALAIADGVVADLGPSSHIRARWQGQQALEASGKVVIPGFVDPHTHALFVGDRAAEFEMRVRGASYMEIMAAGGGITSTVRQVRAAGLQELVEQSLGRLQSMLAHGTTTVEIKTGYGLDTENELKMLAALLELEKRTPLEIVPTFLGAHALPEAFRQDPDAYVDLVVQEMLPAVKEWWQEHAQGRALPFVDVFCEEGAFDLDQARRILTRARELGFPLKIHADEFKPLGGTALAVELGAVSADHLVQTPARQVQALARSSTVAVALPCTPFGLGERQYTPAGEILAQGGLLALASDLNPGTAWCESMQFSLALACRYMGLTPGQALCAATINAAAALGMADRIGSLQPGKQADLALLEVPDYRHLGYRFGTNLVALVVKAGQILWRP
jgi:imidazolonepropionase